MIEDLKLVNRLENNDVLNQTPFNSSSDIDFDNLGHFKRCTDDGLEQSFLKSILTETQLDGYGTDIYSFIGKKNIEYIKGRLLTEILSTVSILSTAQKNYLRQYNTFDKDSIVHKIYNLLGTKTDKNSLQISCSVRSLLDEWKDESSLQEINIQVQQ